MKLSLILSTFWMAVVTVTVNVNAFSAIHHESHSRVFVSTPSKTHPRLVQDCMTPNPICLKTTDTVDEAIHILLQLGFNGAPVKDPITNNLVGVISAFDFLQKEEGGTLLPMQGTEEEMMEVMRAAQKICAITVGELMTPLAATVPPTMTMREASEIMLRDRCHRLCVVDDNNNLIGVLATSDVMRDLLKVVQQALPESKSSTTTSTTSTNEEETVPP